LGGKVDVTLVTDPRFQGGTASAFLTDVEAFLSAGLKVAVVLFRSGGFFQPDDLENNALRALTVDMRLVFDPVSSHTIFLHNPQVFGNKQLLLADKPLCLPQCDRLFMVAHHPPFLGDGALCYDPLTISRGIAHECGQSPQWLPVSGLLREQLRSFRPFLDISREDWVNSFDTAAWPSGPARMQSAHLVVGRHGRAHPDKWPDKSTDLAASLPASPLTEIHVLGADPAFFAARGVDTSGWQMLPFGAQSAQQFLAGLDVFSYFHGSRWREAFGRTVAEAMMSGVRCILDTSLRPTFGNQALYCRPTEVSALLDGIRDDPRPHIQAAQEAGEWCRQRFSTDDLMARYQRILSAPSARWEGGASEAPPLRTFRKWLGFHRRNRKAQKI
jgi:hypothetical protein